MSHFTLNESNQDIKDDISLGKVFGCGTLLGRPRNRAIVVRKSPSLLGASVGFPKFEIGKKRSMGVCSDDPRQFLAPKGQKLD